MFAEFGESIDVACSAATPTDIQWMVGDRYGLVLIGQDSVLESGLITRHRSGVRWTVDSAFVHHSEAEHLAVPFVVRLLQAYQGILPERNLVSKKASGHSVRSSCLIRTAIDRNYGGIDRKSWTNRILGL
jgi:hypothetical protein